MIVDDSIVRGNTMRALVAMLFEAGAAEVHVRISSPPVVSPCFYGIDMADEDELAAAHRSVEEMREHVGATSLHYLSLDGMQWATGLPEERSAAPASRGATRRASPPSGSPPSSASSRPARGPERPRPWHPDHRPIDGTRWRIAAGLEPLTALWPGARRSAVLATPARSPRRRVPSLEVEHGPTKLIASARRLRPRTPRPRSPRGRGTGRPARPSNVERRVARRTARRAAPKSPLRTAALNVLQRRSRTLRAVLIRGRLS